MCERNVFTESQMSCLLANSVEKCTYYIVYQEFVRLIRKIYYTSIVTACLKIKNMTG
jgi:hypothetical protein